MSKVDKTVQEAQSFLGDDLQLTQLHQVFDLQHLMGPVIAYKVLLHQVMNGDPQTRLKAAKILLDASGEPPEKIADRLRASIFKDLSLAQLEAIVQTGITDPAKALEALGSASYIQPSSQE